MTRIIGGSAGGRRLGTVKGTAIRPTSDRVREALFSTVESWCGSLSGLRVLDLYAGSGAVGLEAWSRGAGAVTLVDQDRRSAATIRENARRLDVQQARVEVLAAPVGRVLGGPPAAAYDLVFSDPPYHLGDDDVGADLAALVGHGWLGPGALVVVERSVRGGTPWPIGIVPRGVRRYGETLLWYGHAVGPPTNDVPPVESGPVQSREV